MADQTQVERNRRWCANKAAKTAAHIDGLERRVAALEAENAELKSSVKSQFSLSATRKAALVTWKNSRSESMTMTEAFRRMGLERLDDLAREMTTPASSRSDAANLRIQAG
ncbi:hypothetical protein LG047_13365 [Methylocystis sp. WRRC1]|uniref:hypothetical protein n=1 Tax=Methylocystis sp. WRRC1 TaxID=1732014 RepID=UPI001D14766F|nr:hypothetical protein [Methylocystis sp. WRRC1]MCC3246297.1 hypothetical protein [Methylocystis sp. WRRC1]